jgi:fructose-1-phosphate kinase PfkB-like protein
VNAEEAARLHGRAVATMDAAGAAAREIRTCFGPDGAAIVTRGADGAMIATPEGPVLMGRMYARGPYPVGSGDAFLAGLVVGLECGADWAAASRLALGAAAANAARAGAGRFDADRAEELAARADVFEARVSELPS